MKFTLVLLIAAAILGCVLSCSVAEYEAYKTKMGKKYDNAEDNDLHMRLYCERVKGIEEHNKSGSSFKQGVNQFTDMTPEEMKSSFGLMQI